MDIDAQAGAAQKALNELQQAVQSGLKDSRGKASSTSVAERQKQLASCERLAQRVKNALESYKLELRVLPREQQAEHQHRIRNFEEALRQARAQIDWKRFDTESAAAAAAAADAPSSAAGGASGTEEDGGPMTLEQAVATADHIQNESRSSVARSLGMALQAEQVGIATLEKMHEQNEQMARIGEEVEDIKANIARSKKLVGQIARGAARDRCIQMLCVLITIAIMVMVVLAITGKDNGELQVPDAVRQVGERRLRRAPPLR
mmetsp:Transcript_138686/g.360467  ORF Transcript_138686/g.360467 Transcript_138686/m.360467 type:complete len:262 (-) Transcript_138686:70-855(-)